MKYGSDPNYCLWAAAYNDDADAIRLLLQHGAEEPVTQVFLAATQWSRFAAVEELLKQGADVNSQDSKGMTALHHLLKKGSNEKYIRMLIKHGARGDIKDGRGITAAGVMRRKRDPEFKKLATHLLTGS